MTSFPFISLPHYREFPLEEMKRRASEFEAEMCAHAAPFGPDPRSREDSARPGWLTVR